MSGEEAPTKQGPVTVEEALHTIHWLNEKMVRDHVVIYREANGEPDALFVTGEKRARSRAASLRGILFRQLISYEPTPEESPDDA